MVSIDSGEELIGACFSNHPSGLMFYSDHGTLNDWMNQHGYGCHTFKWYFNLLILKSSSLYAYFLDRVNKDGEFVYIKYHFLADDGQHRFIWDKAICMTSEDPDYSKRDLHSAIERGEKISWTAHVLIMKPGEADPVKLGFDPFWCDKSLAKGSFPGLFSKLQKLFLNILIFCIDARAREARP